MYICKVFDFQLKWNIYIFLLYIKYTNLICYLMDALMANYRSGEIEDPIIVVYHIFKRDCSERQGSLPLLC